jgi:hypothetical protein
MTKDEITSWALAAGWQMVGGYPSLTRPSAPKEAIVRLVLKGTVAAVEIKRPAGKWDQMSSEKYTLIMADPEGGAPLGLGFEKIPGFASLMLANKDRMVFANLGGPPKR